jgi:predicted RND superfamily exporter protein
MKTLMNWLADLVTLRPKWVLLIFSLLTVVAIIGATRINVTFRMRAMYDYPGNPLTAELDQYNEEFGDDGGFAVAVIETKDVFTPPVLRYIQKISRKLKRKPQFRRILSLALNTIPRGHGDEIITGPLFDRVPTDKETLQRIRKTALNSRLAVPRLVSADGRYAMVAAEFKKPINQLTGEEEESGNAAVREVLDNTPKPAGVRVIIGGTSVAEAAGPGVMEDEQKLFLPVGLVLIIIVMVLSFGSWHGVLLTFAEVLLTLAWTFGFMGYAGISINLMSASTPTILMVYGLLDSVFVMTMFYGIFEAQRGDDLEVGEATRRTIRRMGPVCLLTSVSTAIGFASFAWGVLPMVQTFGIGLAVGVIFAFFSSIIWMPALICLLPPPQKHGMRKSPMTRLVAAGLTGLGRFTRRWRWVIIVGSVAVFAGSLLTIYAKAQYNVITLKELPQDMEGIEGINLVADHLLGAVSTGIQITGEPGSMKDPKVFKALDELDEWAEKQEIVTSSLSPSDLIRDMHRAFNGGSAKFDKVPDDRGLISQYLALLDPPTRSDFITDDYARTHLRVMCKDGSYRWWREVYLPLQKKAKALFSDYQVTFPGYMKSVAGSTEVAVKQMIVGFFIAFGLIALLVGVAFRSVRLALLSLLPNLLPTAVAFAVLVAMGISIRISSVLFLSIAVGITYDNTIHLFSAVRDARARGLSHDEAMEETLAEVGPPIVYTSVLIAAGLGIFMLSSFQILFIVGLTSATVVLIGAVSDLLLTTALMGQWGERLLAPKTPPREGSSADG